MNSPGVTSQPKPRCLGVAAAAWLLVAVGIFSALYGTVLMSRTLWPGLHDDAVLFSTPLINRAATGENYFEVYTPFLVKRESVTAFNWHGQLYNAVVAPLLAAPDYPSLLVFLQRVNALGFLSAFAVFFFAARRYCHWPAWGAALLGLACAYATLTLLIYLQGRPDHGIPLAFLLFAFIRLVLPNVCLAPWLEGAVIGVFAAISPLVGAVYGLAVFFSWGLRQASVPSYLRQVALAAAVAFAVYLLLSALAYDGSVWDLLIGTLRGYQEPFRVNLHHLVPFWLAHRMLPGALLPIAVASALAAALLWSSLRRPEFRRAALISLFPLAALGFVFVRQGILFAPHYYTFVALLPAAAWWVLQESARLPEAWPAGVRRFAPGAVLLCMAAVGLGAVRSIALQPSVASGAPSYAEALQAARDLEASLAGGEVIGIHQYLNSCSPVVLARPPWRFKTHAISEPLATTEQAEQKLGFRVAYYFSLQHQEKPPVVEGFELIDDHYSRKAAYLGGFRLLSYSPGYGYAIYRRTDAGKPQTKKAGDR